MAYYGNKKERDSLRRGWDQDGAFEVCITSYQIAVTDQRVFKRKQWGYMVLVSLFFRLNSLLSSLLISYSRPYRTRRTTSRISSRKSGRPCSASTQNDDWCVPPLD